MMYVSWLCLILCCTPTDGFDCNNFISTIFNHVCYLSVILYLAKSCILNIFLYLNNYILYLNVILYLTQSVIH